MMVVCFRDYSTLEQEGIWEGGRCLCVRKKREEGKERERRDIRRRWEIDWEKNQENILRGEDSNA